MMKFASFEKIVELLYKYAIPTPKDQCSKSLQLGVSFAGGYVAGVFCAVVSHPADNLVSFLNNAQGATAGDVSKQNNSCLGLGIYVEQGVSHPCCMCFLENMLSKIVCFTGCEAAWLMGFVYPRSSYSHSHGWNPYRSTVGYI